MNDGLLGVEPLPPQTVEGQCTCECCTQAPESMFKVLFLVMITLYNEFSVLCWKQNKNLLKP